MEKKFNLIFNSKEDGSCSISSYFFHLQCSKLIPNDSKLISSQDRSLCSYRCVFILLKYPIIIVVCANALLTTLQNRSFQFLEQKQQEGMSWNGMVGFSNSSNMSVDNCMIKFHHYRILCMLWRDFSYPRC